jgi:quercetin dioxygenase-like cupin family protein
MEMNAKVLGLLVVCALAAAASSLASGTPIVARALAVGKMKATTIHATTGSMILESIKIAPGGNFGWHTHGAPVAVVVTGGTLTVFDPSVGACAPFEVSKGQSFVEPANHVHLARNDGKTTVTLYALYLGVSKPSRANVPAAEPAGCHA